MKFFYIVLLSLMGCTSTQHDYCDNIYLDPKCIELRKEKEAQREKEMVKVCEVTTGSRINRQHEKCVEVRRDSIKRVLNDPRG